MPSQPNQTATELFAPIASTYERGARVLGLGQDERWRRRMVEGLRLPAGAHVLDVASGTGSITRLLRNAGQRVTSVDLTHAMLAQHESAARVEARAEELPFRDDTFDGLTFGYLLRYVDDPEACLAELMRVTRSGGRLGMVEFGLPGLGVYPVWRFYAGAVLPLAGRALGRGWPEVGRFLRSSIEEFHRRNPDLIALWTRAGLVDVRILPLTFSSGIVMWAAKP